MGNSNHHSPEHPQHGHKANFKEDVALAKMALEAWDSGDPQKRDWAADVKNHLYKTDRGAWNKALDQYEQEDLMKSARKAAYFAHLAADKAHDASLAAGDAAQKLQVLQDDLDGPQSVPPVRSERAIRPVKHHGTPIDTDNQAYIAPAPIPGYDNRSILQPSAPASPAFDHQYRNRPAFHGLDLGLVKLGYNDGGSLEGGVNIGIAKVGFQAGAMNGGEAEFMPYGGPLHARANALVGIDRNQGFVARTGAGGNFFNIVNGDADGETYIGQQGIGVDGDLRGRVLPVDAQFDAGGNVGPRGLGAYTGGDVSLMHQAGVHSGADFELGENSRMAAAVGVEGGGKTADLASHIETDGNRTLRVRPVDVLTGKDGYAEVVPTGDRIDDSNYEDGDY